MFGFTPTDLLAGFQAGVQAAISTLGWATAGSVLVVLVSLAVGRAFYLSAALDRASSRAATRAMAQERMARHEALPYTDETPFAGDADWPNQTHRRAS